MCNCTYLILIPRLGISCRYFEISHSSSLYTMEISKCYTSDCFSPREQAVKFALADHWKGSPLRTKEGEPSAHRASSFASDCFWSDYNLIH